MSEPKDLKIDTSLVDDDLAADPAMREAFQEFAAKFHQAHDAVQRGQYQTIDEALNALGIYPVKVDPETGEEMEGSLQDDMEGRGVTGVRPLLMSPLRKVDKQ